MALFGDARSTFMAVVKGDTSQAVTEFKKLGGAVEKSTSEASGAMGKFKALTSRSLEAVRANAGLFAATTGVALATAAFKAATSAEQLGLEIGKLRDATGLSAEEASRWTEVGKDMGLQADQIAGLISKLTKNLGDSPEKFRQMGIEVQHAADGTVDMNGTLLLAIDRLNAIKDPTQRAAAAQKLFGKSWTDASELIAAGSKNVKARLDEVTGAKIYNDAQISDSRRMRDALDGLKDAGENLVLQLGKDLIPAVTGLAKALLFVVEAGEKAIHVLDQITGNHHDEAKAVNAARAEWDKYGKLFLLLPKQMRGGINSWEDYNTAVIEGQFTQGETGKQVGWLTDKIKENSSYLDVMKNATQNQNETTKTFAQVSEEAGHKLHTMQQEEKDAAAEAANLKRSIEKARQAIKDFQDQIAGRKAFVDLEIDIRNNQKEIDTLRKKFDEGKISAEEFLRLQQLMLDSQSKIADYIATIDGIPPSVTTAIQIAIDSGDMKKIEHLLEILGQIKSLVGQGALYSNGQLTGSTIRNLVEAGARATGGPASGLTMVGERGPELVRLPMGSQVTNAPESARLIRSARGGASAATSVTIDVTVQTGFAPNPIEIGRQVGDYLNQAIRSGAVRLLAAA